MPKRKGKSFQKGSEEDKRARRKKATRKRPMTFKGSKKK